ncbi:MAG TPA: penicillin-insensitive murein endopeptidase [Polyangia bacterium]|jgi:penicillin-insensitive murein endopeptidase
MARWPGIAVTICWTLAFAGCVGPLAFDGTSESIGWPANGTLRGPARLPFKGDGYVIGEPWRARESNHGSDELVEAIVRASRAVARAYPGSVAAVGDLSRASGGGSAEHKSHQSGRDVDVFYYAVRPSGAPVMPGNAMIHYDRAGRSASWSPAQGTAAPVADVPEVRFDVRRNWRFVRALLLDPGVEVQWIFVQKDLAARLIQQGHAEGDDPELLARALAIVRQPSDSEPHDDHMHIRIYCDPDDRAEGCVDKGPARWWKKDWKYMRPPFGRGADTGRAALLEILRARLPLPVTGAKLTT